MRRRKTALNDIRRVRNRKLAQLYCISNFPYTSLAEDDVSKISSYLQGFITDHSLESGKQMTEVLLLGNKHVLENILTNSRGLGQDKKDKEKQGQLSNNKQDHASLEKESGMQPSISSNQQNSALWNELNNKRKLPSSKTNTNNTNNIVLSSESRKSRRQSKPTPQEVTSFELSKIQQLNSFSEKLSKVLTNDIFVANENDKDLLYMLMNESMPTTISPAIPLSKLFYYSRSLQLVKLLVNSNKVLTTNLFESSFLEGKISVVHSRIDELQKQHKWCLKQPKRYIDPFIVNENKQINKSHWDNLLLESSWMAQDFKEGRKYKIATCLMIANAVMDYFRLGKEATCIKRKPIEFLSNEKSEFEFSDKNVVATTDGSMNFEEFISNDILGFELEDEVPEDQYNVDINVNDVTSKNELDLILNENEVKIPENILADGIQSFVDPQQLHDLENTTEIHQEVSPKYYNVKETFPLNLIASDNYLSSANKLILDKLDLYTPFGNMGNLDIQTKTDISMNLLGNEFKVSDIVPVLKLTLPEESDQGWFKLVKKNKERKNEDKFTVNNIDIKGLFQGSASRRNNINIIKPPPPPSTFYLDARSPTIWVPEDDKLLLRLCKLYHNNWSVVSSQLSAKLSKYSYVANISRRTPWQCFERFSQLTSSFPQDLRGAYSQQAQNWFEQSRKLQISTKKRIWPLGVGKTLIQRGHRKLKWASMFEAMRRALKKRENMPKPVTAPALFRKQVSAEDRAKILSPLDLSKLKFGDFDSKANHGRPNSGENSLEINSNNINTMNTNSNSKISENHMKSTVVNRRGSSKNLVENEKFAKINKVEKKPKKQSSKSKIKSNADLSTDLNIPKGFNDSSTDTNNLISNMPYNANDITSTKDSSAAFNERSLKKRSFAEVSEEKNNEFNSKKPTILTSENMSKTDAQSNVPNSTINNNNTNNASSSNGTVDVQKYFTTSYVSSVISDIQTKHPEWNKEEVRNAAARKIAQLHNQIKLLQQKKIQKQKQEVLQRQQLSGQKVSQATSTNLVNTSQTKTSTDISFAGTQGVNKLPSSSSSDIKSQKSCPANEIKKGLSTSASSINGDEPNNNKGNENINNNDNNNDDNTNNNNDNNNDNNNSKNSNNNNNNGNSNTNNTNNNNNGNTNKVNRQIMMNPALSNVLAKLPPSVRTIFENTNIADLTPEKKVEFINKIKKQMKEHGMYGKAVNSSSVPSASTTTTVSAPIANSNILNTTAHVEENENPLSSQNNKDDSTKNQGSMPSLAGTEAESNLINNNSNNSGLLEDIKNDHTKKEVVPSQEGKAEASVSAVSKTNNYDELQSVKKALATELPENNELTSNNVLGSHADAAKVASLQNTSSVENTKAFKTNEENNKESPRKEDKSGQSSKEPK